MDFGTIITLTIGCWCLVSVGCSVLLGHFIGGTPMRVRPVPVGAPKLASVSRIGEVKLADAV